MGRKKQAKKKVEQLKKVKKQTYLTVYQKSKPFPDISMKDVVANAELVTALYELRGKTGSKGHSVAVRRVSIFDPFTRLGLFATTAIHPKVVIAKKNFKELTFFSSSEVAAVACSASPARNFKTLVSFKVKKTTPTRLYESCVLPNDIELDDATCDAVFIDMSSWMLAMFTLDAGYTADTGRNVKFLLTEQLNDASEIASWELKMVISKMVPDLAQLLA
jgi:hypothetical protein